MGWKTHAKNRWVHIPGLNRLCAGAVGQIFSPSGYELQIFRDNWVYWNISEQEYFRVPATTRPAVWPSASIQHSKYLKDGKFYISRRNSSENIIYYIIFESFWWQLKNLLTNKKFENKPLHYQRLLWIYYSFWKNQTRLGQKLDMHEIVGE